MQKHTIIRDGNPPITFTGEELSSATSEDHNSTRWTEITIYRTKGGKIVAHVERFTRWEGESGHDTAEAFDDFGQAIEWLKGDEGTLGRVSQQAVEEAIAKNPELSKFWVQEVE